MCFSNEYDDDIVKIYSHIDMQVSDLVSTSETLPGWDWVSNMYYLLCFYYLFPIKHANHPSFLIQQFIIDVEN